MSSSHDRETSGLPPAPTPGGHGPSRPFLGRRLACVFAHPDDESFGPAATVSRYVALGAEAHLLCGTRGEAGTIGRSATYGRRTLAALRTGELRRAARVIGFSTLRLLDYPDGAVDRIETEVAVETLRAWLAALRPDAVIAFHPDGVSGHADHRAMTRYAREAVARLAGGSPRRDGSRRASPPAGTVSPGAMRGGVPRLHYYTVPASMARRITFRPMPLVDDGAIHVEIDTAAHAAVKHRAILCHRTQLAFYERLRAGDPELTAFDRELFVTEGEPTPAAIRASELLP